MVRVALHALDNHGLRGLLLRALGKLTSLIGLDAGLGSNLDTARETHPWDQLQGTDTGGYIPGAKLVTGSSADLYNTAYYAISPSTLTRALELLPEAMDGYTFVDLGCGKGRALLVAAQFPFAHLVGMELAPELCAIARANAAREPRIRIEQGDAARLRYPAGPLLVFLYHPFLAPVVQLALRNLLRQRHSLAEATWLLYANCTYPKLLARLAFADPVWEYNIPLSPEDAAAHRFGAVHERYTLWRL